MFQTYRANAYERQAQRFVNPLFVADGMGGYYFSSTVIFVRHRKLYYCIFAAHALPSKRDSIENMGMFSTDGCFTPLSDISTKYTINRDVDVVFAI